MDDARYPIGRLELPNAVTAAEREQLIAELGSAPKQLSDAVEDLTDEQIETPYRSGGWTVRQVVHHVPDSHMNGYIRFRFALTEEEPAIKPYLEARWAELVDSRTAPIQASLALLSALHGRWIPLMRGMRPEQWSRAYRHPDMGLIRLDQALALYSWHARHHTAHIQRLRERMGWR